MVQIDLRQYLRDGKAKLWLLLVGIDHYKFLPSLSYAAADCQGLEETFQEVTQEFPGTTIRSHIGSSGTEPVTPQQIQASLAEIAAQSSPTDTVLFYFAGHGDLEPTTKQLYLCLTETEKERLAETGLAVDQVLKQFKQSKVRHQVVMLDACHSGGGQFFSPLGTSRSAVMVETRSASNPGHPNHTHPEFNQALDRTLQQYSNQAKNFHALLACGEEEVSWELPPLGHGAFTHALIEGIRGKAVNDEGYIEIDQLYKFVRDETRKLVNGQQTPHRVAVGSQDIIVGFSRPASKKTAVEMLDSLKSRGLIDLARSERDDCYDEAISGGLLREYPNLSGTEIQARQELANRLGLSLEKTAVIEHENRTLHSAQYYETTAKQRLYESNLAETEIAEILHQEYEFQVDENLAAMFERIYQQISQQFHVHKEQYVTQYRQALRQYGNTQLKIFELRQLQQQLGFSDARIQQFIQDEEDEFKQLKAKCSQDILKHLLEYGEIDEAAKARFQASSGLGVTIIDALIEAVQPEFEQRVRDFIEELQRELYNKGSLDE